MSNHVFSASPAIQAQAVYFEEILYAAGPVFNRLPEPARVAVVDYLDRADRRLARNVDPRVRALYTINEPVLHRALVDVDKHRNAMAQSELRQAVAQYDAAMPLLSKGIRGQVGDFSLHA